MAGTISAFQARAIFTNQVIAVYTDMLAATSFLRTYFPSVQEFTRYVSIQVQRDLELMAVDVMRHSEGTHNNFGNSTDKVIDPPFYHEVFQLNDTDLYDRAFGSSQIDKGAFTQLMAVVARRLTAIRAKIERAIEKQCADVLQTGVITLLNGDSINYRRKAGSLVANAAGNTWATGTTDPFATLAAGAEFLRTVGKSGDVIFDVILGATAHSHLFANTIFKERVTQNLNNSIDSINSPRRNATGAAFHGQLTIGSYKANLWTYPQSYDTVSGSTVTANKYINDKKVIMLPSTDAVFKTAFAAVPKVPGVSASGLIETPQTAAEQFLVEDYIDQKHSAHMIGIKSAPVVVPVSVDKMYTVQPVA